MKISRNVAIAGLATVLCVLYGTVGIYLLRHQFHPHLSLFDSFFYTLVTYATLGSNDFSPTTELARAFICSMVIVGVGCFATVLSLLVAPYVKNKIKEVLIMLTNMSHLKNHVIICGLNAITLEIAQHYAAKDNMDILIITPEEQHASQIQALGFNFLIDNPLHTNVLEKAGISKASVILCALNTDAETILLIMTISQLLNEMNNRSSITAVIQHPPNKDKALISGADNVLLPAVLTCDALFNSAQS